MAPSLRPLEPFMSRLLLVLLFAVSPIASARIELLPGSSPQSMVAFSPLPVAIQVRVTDDQTGAPIPGAQVGYTFALHGGLTLAGVEGGPFNCTSEYGLIANCQLTA